MSALDKNIIHTSLLQCRRAFWGAFWLSLAINILMLLVPIYTLQVLDRVLASSSIETLIVLSFIVVLAIICMGTLQAIRGFVFLHISRWLDEQLSPNLLQRSLRIALCRPEMGSQPLRDLNTLKSFINSPALASFFDAPWSPIYLIVIFMVHPSLGMITMIGACVLLGMALLNERVTAKPLNQANDAQINAMQSVEKMVRNAEVVEAMGMHENMIQRWQKYSVPWQQYQFSGASKSTVIASITRGFRLILQILLTCVGALLVLKHEMTAGGIIAGSILAGKALAPFDAAISIYKSFLSTKKAFKRLVEIGDEKWQAVHTTILPEPKGDISVEHLSYTPPGSQQPVVNRISFKIKAGESIGIIGPSGSGKTTLARLLVGVLSPSSGAVRVDGAKLEHWCTKQRGRFLGYLPQDVELFPGTVKENIARMAVESDDESVVNAANNAHVHEVILNLHKAYETELGTQGSNISAGQRQRIALARCFFGHPKIVVLDEPNSNLDTLGEQALAQCLLRAKRAGITCITIAHRPNILQHVDKILVLHEGQLKSFDESKKVIAKLSQTKAQQLSKQVLAEAG